MDLKNSMLLANMMSNDILYNPILDGSEDIHTISGLTAPYISNNTLIGGGGYLTKGWKNVDKWKLTFTGTCQNLSSIALFLPNVDQRDYNNFTITSGMSIYAYSNVREIEDFYLFHNLPANQHMDAYWVDVTFEKIDTTTLNVKVGSLEKSYNWSVLSSTNIMCIGVDYWSTNSHGNLKNILVKKI